MHTKWRCLKISRYHNSSIEAPGMNQHFLLKFTITTSVAMFSESKGFQVIQHFDDRNKIISPGAARKILLMEILHQLIWWISHYLQLRFYTSQVVQDFFQQYHRTPFCWCFFVPLGHVIPQVKKIWRFSRYEDKIFNDPWGWRTFLDLFCNIKIEPTPLKFDLEGKNETLEDVSPLAILAIWGTCVKFQAVSKFIGQVFSKGIELIKFPPFPPLRTHSTTCMLSRNTLGTSERRFSSHLFDLHHTVWFRNWRESLLSQHNLICWTLIEVEPPMHMNFDPHEPTLFSK